MLLAGGGIKHLRPGLGRFDLIATEVVTGYSRSVHLVDADSFVRGKRRPATDYTAKNGQKRQVQTLD